MIIKKINIDLLIIIERELELQSIHTIPMLQQRSKSESFLQRFYPIRH